MTRWRQKPLTWNCINLRPLSRNSCKIACLQGDITDRVIGDLNPNSETFKLHDMKEPTWCYYQVKGHFWMIIKVVNIVITDNSAYIYNYQTYWFHDRFLWEQYIGIYIRLYYYQDKLLNMHTRSTNWSLSRVIKF